MNETQDRQGAEELDPIEAAALLEQATQKAQRGFDPRPPLLLLAGAPFFLVAFGAVWWSVRHQHPYAGPAGWSLAVLYPIIICWALAWTAVYSNAMAGVGGRSSRLRRAEGLAFATVWIAVYVFQEALHHAGASHAIVYGIYPATAPMIFVGGAFITNAAARVDWSLMRVGVALVVFESGAAYAGPVDVWLVSGIGLCVLLVSLAAVRFGQRLARERV
jgi:hypothetical protein